MSDADLPSQNRRDLTRGSIAVTMILFALPTLGSSALQSLNGSINAVWVGRFLGEEALAATANGNILMFLLISFVFGFGMASTILIGQAMGRHDLDMAKRTIGTALGSIIPLSVLVATGGWLFAPALLDLLGTPPSAAGLALTYLRMIFIAMPATLTFTLLMMALRGTGDSMTPLWFMLMSVGIDLVLTPTLILGLGPFPEWGIFGSALATAIANTLALIGMGATVYLRGSVLGLRGPELRYLWADRVFQVASRAQLNFLPCMRPRVFYGLVCDVANVRPGPIQGGMVHPFINCRIGSEKIEDLGPRHDGGAGPHLRRAAASRTGHADRRGRGGVHAV